MTKYTKNEQGNYVIHGKTYELLVGSRAQVWHGTAYKTSGGLSKKELIQNKHGRIVSESKYKLSKTKGENNLFNKGYTAKKGQFGWVKSKHFTEKVKQSKKHRKSTKRRKYHGGDPTPSESTNPSQANVSPVSESPVPFSASNSIASNATLIGGRHMSRSMGRSRTRGRSMSLAATGGRNKSIFLGGNGLPPLIGSEI